MGCVPNASKWVMDGVALAGSRSSYSRSSLPVCEGAELLLPSLSSHDQCCQMNLPLLPEAEAVLSPIVYM